MLCYRCGGTKKYLGNGMMLTDCNVCNKKYEPIEVSISKIDRRSESYRKAIKDIMSLNPTLSRIDAVKMFDSAYDKI